MLILGCGSSLAHQDPLLAVNSRRVWCGCNAAGRRLAGVRAADKGIV